MKKLGELFEVEYGNKFDFNKMRHRPLEDGGIDFVGRSSENNGITATVAPVRMVEPYEAGLVTVALGGSKLLSAFIQDRPFYTAQNVAVLKSKVVLSEAEKVYLCSCIQHNRFRYSAFGREANRTLRDLLLPEPAEFPRWVQTQSTAVSDIARPMNDAAVRLPPVSSWQPFRLGGLFNIKKGRRVIARLREEGGTPFVGASMKRNGIVGFVNSHPAFA